LLTAKRFCDTLLETMGNEPRQKGATMSVGYYNGVGYKLQRICDVLCVPLKARWWFVYDDNDEATGDHFRTLRELKAWADSQ